VPTAIREGNRNNIVTDIVTYECQAALTITLS
jgi:hypothetical protein